MTKNGSNSSKTHTPPLAEPVPPNGFGIPAENLADINKRFADIGARIETAVKHPTLTVRGSTMIEHADGTRSHFSYRRAATVAEADAKILTGVGKRVGRAKRGALVEHGATNGRLWVGGRPVPTPQLHVRMWRGLKSFFN